MKSPVTHKQIRQLQNASNESIGSSIGYLEEVISDYVNGDNTKQFTLSFLKGYAKALEKEVQLVSKLTKMLEQFPSTIKPLD